MITESLKIQARSEWQLSREVYRPWGKYDSIDIADGYQVKKLTVNPGAKLSVQMHHHRSEHWVVVAGQARVHYGAESHDLDVNESTYHGKNTVHALENLGDSPLELIEVQVGSYLGEDDIVRFSDDYGRV
jgi:mannose-6-phosphate isomerase-like protein (cupin superfamily)